MVPRQLWIFHATIIPMCMESYIRHRALGHQWSVSNAVGVCQVACMVVLLGDQQGPGLHNLAWLAELWDLNNIS